MVVSSGFQGGGLVITDKCEHPELVAQWADYFLFRRRRKAGMDGPGVGESYKLSDDGQTDRVTDGPWGDNQTTILESATLMGQMADPVLIPRSTMRAIRIRMKASYGNSAVWHRQFQSPRRC